MKAPFQRDGPLQGLTWPPSKRDVHPHVKHLVPPVCPSPLTPSICPYPCPPYRLPPRAFRRRPRSLVPGHRRRRRAGCAGGGWGRGGCLGVEHAVYQARKQLRLVRAVLHGGGGGGVSATAPRGGGACQVPDKVASCDGWRECAMGRARDSDESRRHGPGHVRRRASRGGWGT